MQTLEIHPESFVNQTTEKQSGGIWLGPSPYDVPTLAEARLNNTQPISFSVRFTYVDQEEPEIKDITPDLRITFGKYSGKILIIQAKKAISSPEAFVELINGIESALPESEKLNVKFNYQFVHSILANIKRDFPTKVLGSPLG